MGIKQSVATATIGKGSGPIIGILVLLVVFSGCGGAKSSGTTGRAAITVRWPTRSRLIPLASNSIKVTILRGAEIVATQVLARPADGIQTTATFESLNVGTLTLKAAAFPNIDGTGVAQAQGAAPLTITDGQTTNAALTMDSTVDHVDLIPNPISIHQSASITVTAAAKDVSGAIVLLATARAQWTSNNTTVAQVTSAGVVTGGAIGTATISFLDTESGKGTSAGVTVLSSELISFASSVTVTSPEVRGNVLAADFDGDGNPDLVLSGINELGILYGKGDGTFEPYVRLVSSTKAQFTWFAVDMNRDGHLDIVYTDNSNKIVTLFGMTGRAFGSSTTYTGDPITDLAVGDLNNDGFPDIVAAAGYQGASVLWNRGDGSLQWHSFLSLTAPCVGVAIGDLNGDGIGDIVVSTFSSFPTPGGVTVFRGNVSGLYAQVQRLEPPTHDIPINNSERPRLADLTGDGKADMVISNGNTNFAHVYKNFSGSLGKYVDVTSATTPFEPFFGDFDGDGHTDIVVTQNGSPYFTVFRNLGDGHFDAGHRFNTGGTGNGGTIAIADFNHDGKLDIAEAKGSQQNVRILLNNGF